MGIDDELPLSLTKRLTNAIYFQSFLSLAVSLVANPFVIIFYLTLGSKTPKYDLADFFPRREKYL